MPRVLICTDDLPAADGTCTTTAWVEYAPPIEPLSLADAQLIGGHALLAWVTVAAVLLVKKAF